MVIATAACGGLGSPSIQPDTADITADCPDPKAVVVDAEVEEALQAMDLDAKLSQLFVLAFIGTSADTPVPAERELNTIAIGAESAADRMERDPVGGFVLMEWNIDDPETLAALTNGLQQSAIDSGHPGALVMIDEEGGRVTRLRRPVLRMPAASVLGDKGDIDL